MATWKLVTDNPTSNAITAGIGVASTTVAMDLVGLHPIAGAGLATVGSLLHLVAAGMESPDRVGVNLARWGGAGAWSTWALAGDPWTMAGVGTLAVGSAAGAALGPWLRRRAGAPARETGHALVLGSTGRRNQEWTQRISRVCGIKGAVCDTADWDNGCGHDITVTLPQGGATRQDLLRQVDALASDADLPDGCGIQVIASGKGRRTVVLRVSTVNRLKDFIDYPVGKPWTSMLEPKQFGETSSGEVVEAELRENSQLITGPPKSGKTTQLHVLTAECAKTTDGLVWHLDLNGGGLSQAWVDLWVDGVLKRCPIDWPAATADECVRALKAAIRIAKHRKTAYRKRKRAADSGLLPIGPDLPAISVILDEGAEATGNRKIEPLLSELQNIARDSAVILRLSALSPTGDNVPPPMRRNTAVRTAMYSPDEEVYSYLNGHGAGRAMSNDDLAGRGTGFLSADGGAPVPFRGYNITPSMIEDIARDVSAHRVELDEASRVAAGEDYETRWERVRAAFDVDGQVSTPEPEVAESEIVDPSEDWTAGWGDPFDESPPSRTALPAGADGIPDAEVVDTPAATTTVNIVAAALEVFDRENADRLPRKVLADALTGGDEDRVRFLLRAEGVSPLKDPFRWRGELARGYARKDLEAVPEP